ncbi:MAG: DUF819 family protein [Rikenellaceae bacterium]|nr:DUF819 family protein [Rikenellaceae bacterium]
MSIVNYIVLTLIFCLTPALVLWLCRRIPLLGKIGPIMVLYAIGMAIGNLPTLPAEIKPLQDMIPNVMVPLAIPMMLFGCTFSRKELRLQVKLCASGFLSVCVAVVVGYLFFGRHVPQGDMMGGIMSGMYTGGMVNAAALQAIFQIDSENYILMSSYDIIISFLYLVFLLSVGIPMFRRLYGERNKVISQSDQEEIDREIAKTKENPYRKLLTRNGLRQTGKALLLTLAIVAVSAGVAIVLPEGWFMVVFILLITTLGVVASFFPAVRKLDTSYDAGMYLIYIFSITIASMADFSNLQVEGGVNLLIFLTIAIFGSLTIHALLCRLMRIDADSMMVASVSFINSPPFVPMTSAALRNKNSLVTGLAAGIVGYALGNHFGVLMAKLLSLL